MKYWVFNAEQLEHALGLYAQARDAHGSLEILEVVREQELIREFLTSPAAVEAKLLQGTSQ